MPSRKISLARPNTHIREPPEVYCNHRGDVGDGKLIAGDEAAAGQFSVEPFKALDCILLPNRCILGALADTTLEKFMLKTKGIRDGRQQCEFHSPLPHFNHGAQRCSDPEQGWFGM